jgi:4-hydroxy-2-oxoheptanedioate aldolase
VTAPVNDFRQRLQRREQLIGIFATLGSPALTEQLAGAGFDWILLDTEHSPNDVPELIAQLQVLAAFDVAALVRPAWSDPVLVKRVLDAGAQSLLIPYIETAEAAADAVRATRYPPAGIRGVSSGSRAAGYGQRADYLRTADEQICVLVQIETRLGLDNLEAIAAVPGVDGVFIGPNDLAASMGHLGRATHPDVLAAVDDAFARLAALDVASGYLTADPDEARRVAAKGVHVMGVATDTSIVNTGAAAVRAGVRRP